MEQVNELSSMLNLYKEMLAIREDFYDTNKNVWLRQFELRSALKKDSSEKLKSLITCGMLTTEEWSFLIKPIETAIKTAIDAEIERLEKRFKEMAIEYWKEIPKEENEPSGD